MNILAKQIAAALLLAGPGAALALGLGEIDVKSTMNQPLRAEIELIYSSAAEAEAAQAKLANAEDFERVGLDAGMITAPLQFSVGRNDAGRYVINVTTATPVQDPFVDFLIEVNWANGKLLREYVVLLDPPIVAPSSSAPVYVDQATTTQPFVSGPATSAPSSSSSSGSSRGVGGEVTYGPVKSGDTLWEIASNWRPDESVSVNQMMVMLLQMNPDAFQNNNINLLKRGAVLRLPGSEDFNSLSEDSALAEVRSQNRSWQEYVRSRSGSASTVSDAGVSAEVASASPDTPGSVESRLRLRQPSADSDVDAGSAVGTGALRTELNETQAALASNAEELAAANQENSELRSRVNELEQLVEQLRTLNVEDSDLAQLQAALDQAADDVDADGLSGQIDQATDDAMVALDAAAADTVDGIADGADDTLASISDSAGELAGDVADAAADQVDAVADGIDDAATAVVDTASEQAQVVKTLPKADAGGGIMGLLKRYWYAPLALLGLLAGGVFFARRNREEPEFAPVGGGSILDKVMETAEPLADEIDDSATVEMEAAVPDFDEAGLISAIDETPDNPQTHLALLRSYYSVGAEDKFAVAAMRMQGEIDENNPSWNEVRSMGKTLLPDNPMFTADADLPDDLSAGDFELDLDADTQPNMDLSDLHDSASAASEQAADSLADVGADLAEVADDLSLDMPDTAASDLNLDLDSDADGMDFDLDLSGDADDGSLDLNLDDLADDAGDGIAATGAALAGAAAAGGAAIGASATAAADSLDLNLDDVAASTDEQMDDALADLGDLDLGESDMFGSDDAISTKLDLAETYMRMGDPDGARGMLEEVVNEGSDEQKARAQQLLEELDF